MKKFLKVLGAVFSALLVTAIVFGVGYFFGNRSNGGKAEVVPASSSGIDLKLPGEVENPSSLWMKLRRRFLKSVSLQHAKEITP